jgi:aminoacrylate hydrolase
MMASESLICRAEDGAALNVCLDGAGPSLLLVTGLGGAASFWDPVVHLLAHRWRVIRFDQRGIGRSTRGSAATSIDRLAKDAHAVLRATAAGRTVLVGHSTGGVILQAMALQDAAPIRAMVLSGSWLKPSRYMQELFRSRLALLRAAPREYAAMACFLGWTADWVDTNWDRYEAAVAAAPVSKEAQDVLAERIGALVSFDLSDRVHAIKVPVLVQGAEDDLIVPAFLQRELKAALPGSDLAMLATGGHFFPVTRSEATVEAIAAWAGGLAAG